MTQTDSLLRYRPYRGRLRGPMAGACALTRMSLLLMMRRRLTWGLFALGLLVFFFFFYGQYLIVWLTTQIPGGSVPIAGFKVNIADLMKFLDRLALNGSAHTFGNFIWFEGYVVVIVLALAGSVLVGNDFAHGSLPFYLSKPIGRRHYLLGKGLAIAGIVSLFTTLPAILLYIEAGLLFDWTTYYIDNISLLLGILGYGTILTLTLSLLLLATSVWVRKTVPMVMLWMGLFVFARLMAAWLVDGLKFDERWRLIDLWNDLYLLGLWCLQADPESIRPQPQPTCADAGVAVGMVCAMCLLYLRKRVQAVEVVK